MLYRSVVKNTERAKVIDLFLKGLFAVRRHFDELGVSDAELDFPARNKGEVGRFLTHFISGVGTGIAAPYDFADAFADRRPSAADRASAYCQVKFLRSLCRSCRKTGH